MAQYIIEDTTLADIADAIRGKTGKSAAMTPLEMPEEITNIPTGSGTETKVLLWTNDAPTTAIGAFDATLSESIDNFDYLEIEYAYGTQTVIKSTVRTPVFLEDGVSYAYPSNNTSLRGMLGIYNANNSTYSRRYYYKDSTTITFTTAATVNVAGTATTPCIPYNIYGIKIVHVPTRKTAIGTFSHKTSATSVDIGFKPAYLCIWSGSDHTAISTYNSDWSTTKAFYSGAGTYSTSYTMSGNSTNYRLHAITDTGFTMNKAGSACTAMYFAIGEEE